MLMRWVGAALLLTACAGLGIGRSRELRSRTASIRRLLIKLQRLSTEVCCLCTPLPEVLALLCSAEVDAAELRERPFSEIWQREIGGLGLAQAEREVMEDLGQALSRGDEPERAFSAAAARLEVLLHEAEDAADKKCRLCTASGFCGGLLLVIVLI